MPPGSKIKDKMLYGLGSGRVIEESFRAVKIHEIDEIEMLSYDNIKALLT